MDRDPVREVGADGKSGRDIAQRHDMRERTDDGDDEENRSFQRRALLELVQGLKIDDF